MTDNTTPDTAAQLGHIIQVIVAAEKTGIPLARSTTETVYDDLVLIASNTRRDMERLKEFMTSLGDVMARLKAVSK